MGKNIKVRHQYVVVEQLMESKSNLILLDKAKKDEDKFNYSFKIVQLGSGCGEDIKVGDIPIFAEHVRFQGIKVLEKTKFKMRSLVIVHEGDIIATEEEGEEPEPLSDLNVADGGDIIKT